MQQLGTPVTPNALFSDNEKANFNVTVLVTFKFLLENKPSQT
jgi:hypothetical protein